MEKIANLKIRITGVVQGVGFRPFVYRLATELGLKGYVLNSESGVVIEVEGEKEKLEEFLLRLQEEKPPISKIYSLEYKFLPKKHYLSFEIRKSEKSGKIQVSVLPDLATCEDCLRELFNLNDRRYRYPFINCTNCGPRFTIIERLPYDRPNTTMKEFKMCNLCKREYEDPSNRRFHAQPNACPICGPYVTFVNEKKEKIAEKEDAIRLTIEYLEKGKIIALKGLGGFHLICDATNEKAVKELRKRKQREEKPFAVMFPDFETTKKYAYISSLEKRALKSVESPIVILEKKENTDLAYSISPENKTIGAFLPYTPLHHIILKDFGKPIVATSANLTDEPIIKENEEAISIIGKIADAALIHNRRIARRCDDSVVRIMAGRQIPIRRSRGFAPLPVILPFELKRPVLALGVHMKNTIAVAKGNKVYISQHIGDIDNPKAERFFEEVIKDMLSLFEVEPQVVVCDRHPFYYSTKFGEKRFKEKLVKVYHHHAHIISVMAENEVPLKEKVIGLAFDGTGYGKDGTIWGGEFLIAEYTKFERAFHLKTFKLPGGDKAVKEPYRVAVSLLLEAGIDPETILKKVEKRKIRFIRQMIEKEINTATTSSMGRLFDGVAAILGIRNVVSYHAQAAILLEQIALNSQEKEYYQFDILNKEIDWKPVITQTIKDLKKGVSISCIAKKFHNTIVEIGLQVSLSLREKFGINIVAFSGGVFQNKILTESLTKRLEKENFRVLLHQLVPPNDGGISLGQAVYGGLFEKNY
ncbi:Acylphosphatase [Desulfurobacterium thermolithotrophum DSM 11699]|uniref:Carbamoyltransferase n=1 Tax=Desulfurobacterium thermolithotrophum (strain DSM 11699 / BSA) TaxID=868864 RepID=F0S2N0_DESTD|nr:carbamoyltransferase HypF [Desulfurobacterium thermolithotrophum]ADY73102.1 Acylphosphatase [Desulfurobacterium thermolithotrophum DSM 11699]